MNSCNKWATSADIACFFCSQANEYSHSVISSVKHIYATLEFLYDHYMLTLAVPQSESHEYFFRQFSLWFLFAIISIKKCFFCLIGIPISSATKCKISAIPSIFNLDGWCVHDERTRKKKQKQILKKIRKQTDSFLFSVNWKKLKIFNAQLRCTQY